MHHLTIYSPWQKDGRWLPGAVPYWQGALSTDALLSRMTQHTETGDKGQTRCWSPVELAPGARRSNANVVAVSCLVLDYDAEPISRAQVMRGLGRVRMAYHSSHSHTDAKPKGRLIVPLATPCPVELWPRMWRWAAIRLPGIDPACKDASRVYYLPTHPPGMSPVSWRQDGPLLSVPEKLPELPKPPPYKPVADTSDRSLMDALRRPDVRARLADGQGWRVSSGTARRIPCPQCSRPSVYYVIDSEAKARCGHMASCGGTFWLDQLIGETT